MHAYYSNRAEILYRFFKESAFVGSNPFRKRLVIVPSPAMKSWLMLQMAQDADLEISMGIEISYLNQAFQTLQPSASNVPNEIELVLAIETELRKIFQAWTSLTSEERLLWTPLFHYLKLNPEGSFVKIGDRRLALLCNELASLFRQYGIYGGKIFESRVNNSNWQTELWRRIFECDRWSYLYKSIKEAMRSDWIPPYHNLEIHLFALSFLPKIWHDYLSYLACKAPVNIYILSPCQAFWTDLLSDKESQKLLSFWQKRGVPFKQQEELEIYLRDNNSLLANFGRLGREMAQQIEKSNAPSCHEYLLPEVIKHHPSYESFLTEEIVFEDRCQTLTLLKMVQSDLILLRNPQNAEKISFEQDENSIQFHFSTDKMREVQNIYHLLLGIIQRHAETSDVITPKDILVMAPDISLYAPYIDHVFKGEESLLQAKILDLSTPKQNIFIQSFLSLLSLSSSRWDVKNVLNLLDLKAFQRRHKLDKEDAERIKEWIKAADVRWGVDPEHRDELLIKDQCHQGMTEKTMLGTWEHAIDRLLLGLTTIEESEVTPLHIDATLGTLLGKWILLIRSLFIDLSSLQEDIHLSPEEWACYLKCLISSYLEPENKTDEQLLLAYIENFAKAGSKLEQVSFPFTSIRHHLENLLNKPDQDYKETQLQAVHFCSLLPMRAIPAKVIVMLGMEEGAFPKSHSLISSLNLLASNSQADFSPLQTDYDRFLFLETLLSARNYFILSYQGYEEGGKEHSPSLLLTELLNYLDSACIICEEKPSKKCMHKHPKHPFDPLYFSQNGILKSYSTHDFHLAKAGFASEKKKSTSFLSLTPFINCTSNLSTAAVIDIKEIERTSHNPIRAYLNQLGMYIEKKEKRLIKNEEDFHLSSLQKHLLKKRAFGQSTEQIIGEANKEGKLPLGGFKSVAIAHLQQEISLLRNNLQSLGVQSESIFSLKCSVETCIPIKTNENEWLLPPLQIPLEGKTLQIIGNFSEIADQGLIVHSQDTKIDLIKQWPHYLFFHCLIKQFDLPIRTNLLLVKGKKGKIKTAFLDDPFPSFIRLIRYYFTALESASPLIPEWVPFLMALETDEEINAKIQETLTNPHQQLYNEELKWVFQKNYAMPDLKTWRGVTKELYSDLYANW